MGEMNLKIIDEHMIGQIMSRAKLHNRTPDLEALEILAAGLEASEPFDFVKEARRIAAMTPKDGKQTDSTLLIREDREDPTR